MTAIFTTLISAEAAREHLNDPSWAFVDCRFLLQDPAQGLRDYRASHILGAAHADLDHDLSGDAIRGKTGRHPLPARAHLVAVFERLGIDASTQVVAYDDNPGHLFASRLWWLLKWAGHDAVAVLDGGFKRWAVLGYPVAPGDEARAPRGFTPHFREDMAVDATVVERLRVDPAAAVIDVRAAERFRGQSETIDPVAGHIPGARNLPFTHQLGPDGLFKPSTELRELLVAATGSVPPARTVYYCGSGVTATQAALVSVHAGLGMPLVYVGSWSDWITDPTRPVATGE